MNRQKASPYWVQIFQRSHKEVREWFDLKKTILQFFLIVVVLTIAFVRWRGVNFALLQAQNLLLPELIVIIILIFFVPLVAIPHMFWVAARRDNDQREEIESYQSKELKLSVEQGTNLYLNNANGDIIPCLVIDVISYESRKIIELEAYLSRIFQWTEEHPDDRSVCNDHSGMRILAWESGNYKSDLTPGFPESKIRIAILNCMSREFSFMNHEKINLKSLQQNALYRIGIHFKGKLEGSDPDYRYFRYETEFVCAPQDCILDFLPNAADFPNFPKGLEGKLRPPRAHELSR